MLSQTKSNRRNNDIPTWYYNFHFNKKEQQIRIMKSNKNNFQYIKTKSLKMKEKVKKLPSYSSKFYVKYIIIMIKIDV